MVEPKSGDSVVLPGGEPGVDDKKPGSVPVSEKARDLSARLKRRARRLEALHLAFSLVSSLSFLGSAVLFVCAILGGYMGLMAWWMVVSYVLGGLALFLAGNMSRGASVAHESRSSSLRLMAGVVDLAGAVAEWKDVPGGAGGRDE